MCECSKYDWVYAVLTIAVCAAIGAMLALGV